MSTMDQFPKPEHPSMPEPGSLREYLCKLEPLRIPRPKCSGMEFVQTSGRQGFYLSLRRKEQKNGHTPLSAISFTPPSPPQSQAAAAAGGSTNGKDQGHNFEHRLNEAASGLSLGNGRHHHGEQQKNSSGRQSMTKLSA